MKHFTHTHTHTYTMYMQRLYTVVNALQNR